MFWLLMINYWIVLVFKEVRAIEVVVFFIESD